MYKYSEVEPMKYAYTNGVLLDGSADMQPQRGMVLRTDGEKILDIVPEGTDLTGFEIVDLKGGYLMPGLINLHVHLPASGSPKKQGNPRKLVKFMTSMALTRRIALAMCEGYAKTQLLSGVTTIRTVGGIADIDTRLRGRIAAGKCDGPRILAADMAVSVPGGHMAGSLAYEATSAAQAAEDVRKIAQGKPDLIKLMITGGVLSARRAARRTGSACPLRRMSKVPRACAWRSKTAWIRSSTAQSRTRKFCAFSASAARHR